MNSRVLVVEDDPSIAAGLVQGLRRHGFVVALSTEGRGAVVTALAESFDVIVLDLMLPEQNGFEVLSQLRCRIPTPIVVLSARTGIKDRLASFELGAVDYVAKPFFIEELVARLHARLPQRPRAASQQRRFAGVLVDLDARTVQVGGQPVALTRTEFSLLVYLLERPTRAVPREQLAADILLGIEEASGRTVDAHVARLRKKLGDAAARITTVWGIGYRFVPDEEKVP